MSSVTASIPAAPPRRHRLKSVLLWALQISVAAMFLSAGADKLAGDPAMVQAFDEIGLGQWFRFLTGGLEVLGAVLLVVPALSGIGALLLAGVMVGAILTHLLLVGGSALPALVLLIALAVVVAGRREGIRELLRRVHG